jgi:hypothetical protein
MKESRSLDDYLATLYEGAQLDSQGQFTVDLDRRTQKLAQYQLLNPENFVLGLVSAATLGGASLFQVTTTQGGFMLEFDGEPLQSEELERLHRVLTQGSVETADRRLQHLGMALHQVRNLHFGRVQWEGKGCGDWLDFQGRRIERVIGADCPATHRLTVQGGSEGIFSFLFASRAVRARQAVFSLLEKRCSWGPIRLQWDSGVGGVQWMTNPGVALTIHGGAPPGLMVPGAPITGHLEVPELAAVRGVILLSETGAIQEFLLISCGVAFPLAFRGQTQGGCQILLWCNDWKTDLSLGALVEDPNLQAVLRAVPGWLSECQLVMIARLYAGRGIEKILRHPGLAQMLWSYRQQVAHSLPGAPIQWNGDLDWLEALWISATRTYRRLRALPVTREGEIVEGGLDDGSSVLPMPNEHERFLRLLFPVQQPFVFFRGRAAPHFARGTRILWESLFWRSTPMLFDAQLGLHGRPDGSPGQIWRYQNGCWLDGWEAPECGSPFHWVPPGVTLGLLTLAGNEERLTQEQLFSLLQHLFHGAMRSGGEIFLEHWLRALIYWQQVEGVSPRRQLEAAHGVLAAIQRDWAEQPLLATCANDCVSFRGALGRPESLQLSAVNQQLWRTWLTG